MLKCSAFKNVNKIQLSVSSPSINRSEYWLLFSSFLSVQRVLHQLLFIRASIVFFVVFFCFCVRRCIRQLCYWCFTIYRCCCYFFVVYDNISYVWNQQKHGILLKHAVCVCNIHISFCCLSFLFDIHFFLHFFLSFLLLLLHFLFRILVFFIVFIAITWAVCKHKNNDGKNTMRHRHHSAMIAHIDDIVPVYIFMHHASFNVIVITTFFFLLSFRFCLLAGYCFYALFAAIFFHFSFCATLHLFRFVLFIYFFVFFFACW